VVYIVFMDMKDHFISCSFITNINTKEVNKMADIKISNLSGFDLFNDAESFMSEVNNNSVDVIGGLPITQTCPTRSNVICGWATNCGWNTGCVQASGCGRYSMAMNS
jgi:hypothetical protein